MLWLSWFSHYIPDAPSTHTHTHTYIHTAPCSYDTTVLNAPPQCTIYLNRSWRKSMCRLPRKKTSMYPHTQLCNIGSFHSLCIESGSRGSCEVLKAKWTNYRILSLSTSSHYAALKPKYPGYKRSHLVFTASNKKHLKQQKPSVRNKCIWRVFIDFICVLVPHPPGGDQDTLSSLVVSISIISYLILCCVPLLSFNHCWWGCVRSVLNAVTSAFSLQHSIPSLGSVLQIIRNKSLST